MISVAIPVKDGGADLVRCLDGIARQRVRHTVEIVIVDSGSRDDSVRRARERGAEVYEIGATEFLHGRARNLAAERSRGDFLVFTSQDAVPEREDWLEQLTAPLEQDEALAGVYGRQIPHGDAPPPERFFLDFLYGLTPRVQRASSPDDLSLRTTLFSNVNSAIRRSLWERFRFAEDIFFAEDQDWARRVLLAGYGIRYEPEAVVRHSHAYTLRSAFKRFFDLGANADRAFLAGGGASSSALRRDAVRYGREELAWLARTDQRRWIPYAALYELAKYVGLQVGARHRLLPLKVKRLLSSYPAYWDHQAASAQKTGHGSDPGSVSR
jgi:rhamnosyltransferase